MADYWEDRATEAALRREKLMSFGPYARGVLVDTRNGPFVVDPEDGGVGAVLLHEGDYGRPEIEFAEVFIRKEGNVLVVGAHLGSLAVPFSRMCCRLVAIEANPRTFQLLQANVLLNRATNIDLHNVLAADTNGESVEFILSRDNSGGSKRRPVSSEAHYMYDDPQVVTLTTKSVDSIVGNTKFDFVLMDIEGSEIFALRGMPMALAGCETLAIEFRPHHIIDVAGAGIAEFSSLLVPHFNFLFVPGLGKLVGRSEMSEALHEMFRNNECHDVIYFFKSDPSAALNGTR